MNIIELFEDTPDVVEVPVGEAIFERGDPGDRMYVVLEGIVEIRLGDRVLETVDPGGIFGEMAIIDPAIRSATAVAQSACRLAIVDQEFFLHMVQQAPPFALAMMRILAARLRKADRKLEPSGR